MSTDIPYGDVAEADPYCVCCCRPKSAHDRGQCPETTYFIPIVTAPPARTYAEGVESAFRAGHRAARIRYAPAEPNGPTRFENVDWEDSDIRLLLRGEKA